MECIRQEHSIVMKSERFINGITERECHPRKPRTNKTSV